MAKDIYERLAKHLDNLPGGFPSTESGVELRILRRLFSPEEAELALNLTLIAEVPATIAHRLHRPEDEIGSRLEAMARKGLIYRLQSREGPPKYMAWQFAIGIWEFHVNDLSPGLVRDMEEYLPTLLNVETWKKAPQLRTIPIGQSIPVEHKILPYERAEELVRSHQKILVAPCICRRERKIAGEGCLRPEETCLIFGRGADYYLTNGIGRLIDQEEALRILKEADKAGLVLQPSNSQEIVNICCCCGCCCGVLRTIKRHPRPGTIVSSPFRVSIKPETCEGCGTCLSRCPMDALHLIEEKIASVDGRCIGCGLCVSTCPSHSLSLERKPSPEQRDVPETMTKSYLKLARARGKLGQGQLLKMRLKSRL
jgi:electron transport complex protein RnfB